MISLPSGPVAENLKENYEYNGLLTFIHHGLGRDKHL